MFFQLAVSALPTAAIESSLLPTPNANEERAECYTVETSMKHYQEGRQTHVAQWAKMGLLPTPKTMDVAEDLNAGKKTVLENGVYTNVREKDGMRFGPSLNDLGKAGLLPTPIATDGQMGTSEKVRQRVEDGKSSMSITRMAEWGLLPTPLASEMEKMGSGGLNRYMREDLPLSFRKKEKGKKRKEGVTPPEIVEVKQYMDDTGLLNTPTASDKNGGCTRTNQKLQEGSSLVNQMHSVLNQKAGTTSQLSVHFVAEMMSFPVDYLVLPFLSGETKE